MCLHSTQYFQVQIDESVISKRKHHRGRVIPQIWVFGGVEMTPQGSTGRGFLLEVPNRERDTLWPIIQQNIQPGSRIVTDCWSAYVTDPDGPREHRHIEDIAVNPRYTHEFVSNS